MDQDLVALIRGATANAVVDLTGKPAGTIGPTIRAAFADDFAEAMTITLLVNEDGSSYEETIQGFMDAQYMYKYKHKVYGAASTEDRLPGTFEFRPSREFIAHTRTTTSVAEGQDVPPPKRPPKRQRFSKFCTENIICPITRELFFQPVTAMDGFVYEEWAIQHSHDNLCRPSDGKVLSPMTGMFITACLLPAPQIKNIVANGIEAGLIDDEDLLNVWNEKMAEKKAADDLLRKAATGDANAMYEVGKNYDRGIDGFKQNEELAFEWYKKAHTAGDIRGTALLGWYYGHGSYMPPNMPPNNSLATLYLGMAAARGSNYAALYLGKAYTDGDYGLPVDREEAIRWLRASVDPNCRFDHLLQVEKNIAQRMLDIHLANITN